MDNSDTLATLGTHDKGRRHTNSAHQRKQPTRRATRTPQKTGCEAMYSGRQFLPLITHQTCYACSQDV